MNLNKENQIYKKDIRSNKLKYMGLNQNAFENSGCFLNVIGVFWIVFGILGANSTFFFLGVGSLVIGVIFDRIFDDK